MAAPNLYLGAWRPLEGSVSGGLARMPAHHLVTHAAIFGMTGSGKTGLLAVTVEEALRSGVPTLMIDVKGDLPNLLLTFPRFDPTDLVPWVEPAATSEEKTVEQVAQELNDIRKASLEAWSIGEPELKQYTDKVDFRVITPGSTAGELLHVLSSLERRSDRWDTDPESARAALSAAVSLVLRLLGRDPDPAKSREHVLLSVLAEERLRRGEPAPLAGLLQDLNKPPIEKIGALGVDAFLPKTERKALAAALNTLLASPTFASWREGATLDVGDWLKPKKGKNARRYCQCCPSGRRGASVGARCTPRGSLVLGALVTGFKPVEGVARVRRSVRLLTATPREPTDQTTLGGPHEASESIRCGRTRRDAKPHGRRLPSPW